jgi:hypothetical protein
MREKQAGVIHQPYSDTQQRLHDMKVCSMEEATAELRFEDDKEKRMMRKRVCSSCFQNSVDESFLLLIDFLQ